MSGVLVVASTLKLGLYHMEVCTFLLGLNSSLHIFGKMSLILPSKILDARALSFGFIVYRFLDHSCLLSEVYQKYLFHFRLICSL